MKIGLPARPAVINCPPLPLVEGDIINGTVVLPLQQALTLQNWIHSNEICHQTNRAELEGYVEKLENRLKAVSQ